MFKRLSERQKEQIDTFSDTLTPKTELYPLRASDINVGEEVGRTFRLHPFPIRIFFLFSLWLVEYICLFLHGHRFSYLDPSLREKLLETWLRSPFYIKAMMVKFIAYVILMTQYEDDRVRAAIGLRDRRGL